MKKLVFGLIATVMFSFVGSANSCLNLEDNTHIELKSLETLKIPVTISIDFGRKSKGCTGFGICKIDITFDLEDVFQGVANDMGGVDVTFGEKRLNQIKETFKSTTVILEEDYVLPDNLCEKLELKRGYKIRAGKYTVKNTEDGQYVLRF